MFEAKGDYEVAAVALGVTVSALQSLVRRDPQLRAAWIKGEKAEVQLVTEADAARRTKEDSPILQQLAEDVRRENLSLMAGGLANAGIGKQTLEQLGAVNMRTPN